ncbi:MAG: serine/threonine protein kinase [Hyalangium sp.]|uniref:serine/threonine protein kinase n=1 Tax=Hyalangium sp. TaxID=2028555 RepID=UPI003899D9DD
MSQSVPVQQVVRRRRRRHTSVLEIGPGTDVGSYAVEARVGAGGFGTVFRARRGGELYALKFLSLAECAGWAEREAVVLTRVRHRNVARLSGFSQWPDKQPRYLVLAMEYVAGQRLDEWARAENPSARRVLELLRNLSQGLGAAHGEGVVHRDVKEANILVRQEDGEAVLVDFGVSGHAQAARVTPGRMPPGTLEYRSPEAWRFARDSTREPSERYRPTPADDMYALGVVLYWLLTEELPFPSKDEVGVDVEAVLTKRPVPPQERNARVPRELSELCLRLLAQEAGARPDAAGLGQAVEELLTRQGAEWDGPLFEPYSEHNRTTQGEGSVDETEQWAKAPPRPRRGKRPAPGVEPEPADAAAPVQHAVPGVPVTEAVQPVPAQAAAQAPRPADPALPSAHRAAAWRHRAAGVAGVGLLLALGVLAFALGTRGHAPTQAGAGLEWVLPTSQGGWKVARPLKPPEAERAAPLEDEGALAAPVEFGSTAPQHEASVKIEQQKQPQRLGPVKKAAALVGACTTLACTGPQVRTEPPSEPCPPGAVEAMAELKIGIGDKRDALFNPPGTGGEVISVRQGWTSMRLQTRFGGLRPLTTLKGRLIFGGERVYGRFTEARDHDGTRTWPVCLELLDHNGKRGMELETGSTADTARVFNSAEVKAVDRFE